MNRFELQALEFWDKAEELPRQELLGLLNAQNPGSDDPDEEPGLLEQLTKVEWVFENKLSHISWDDGTPVDSRPFTNQELALLLDPPFMASDDLLDMGISIKDQKKMHYSSDAVLWAKHFLKTQPRVYQSLILRWPNNRKVLRAGRRLGKTIAMGLMALHRSYTNKNHKTIVVAPMKAQVQVIFEKVLELAAENPLVEEAITRSPSQPNYEIYFSNGSTIRLFTSGMKSGGRSDVVRGQEADLIVLDEVDYMADDDLDALYAMLQQTSGGGGEKVLIGASTPSGRKSTFWDWCHKEKLGFKEFWFPSYVNPFFTPEMEHEQRNINTEMAFRHEIEADWGEDTDGAFPKRYVDQAFISPGWDYVPDLRSARAHYVFGVDWNKYEAGVNVVVVEICEDNYEEERFQNRLRVTHREEIIKENFTLLAAVDRIVELNSIFRPKHIYVDKGYGEVQTELLHKYGKNHPETGLHTKVKPIDSGSSIEMRDPWTKEVVKKDTKPFLVDNLRRLLERNMVLIPGGTPEGAPEGEKYYADEELHYDLISYVVQRTTPTGRPVFEAVGSSAKDHILDALMLACLAVAENYDSLMKVDYATKAFPVKSEAFAPLLELSSDPAIREKEEDIIEEKWGDKANAPVLARRPMAGSGSRGRSSRRIRRSTF